MATTVKEGNFIYRINPTKPTELQRATIGSNSWSFVVGCNGAQIFDITTRGSDIIMSTSTGIYIRSHSGIITKK